MTTKTIPPKAELEHRVRAAERALEMVNTVCRGEKHGARAAARREIIECRRMLVDHYGTSETAQI